MSAGAFGDGLTTMTPTWFGPEDSPLFGWLHLPGDRRVRGFVVLCPPIGLELLLTYRTMRILANKLAESGVGVLRFAYAATGDSAGDSAGPDRVAGWLSSIAAAVAYVRSMGAPHVVGIGLRLGATLAATASRSCKLDGLVLWDPCESGASFLKEERALFRLGVPTQERVSDRGEGIEGPGVVYSAETVAGLGRIGVTDLLDVSESDDADVVHPGVGPVLVVSRCESRARAGVLRMTSAAGVDSFAVHGQPLLFDWYLMAVPIDTLDRIASWTSGLLPDERSEVTPEVRGSAVVATTADGIAIRERVIEFGEAGLFGIVTEVDGAGDAAMILTNAAPPACHIGPARMWVDLARAFAARGARVLRFDDAGLGDSPGGDGLTDPAGYTEAQVLDIVTAVEAVRAVGGRDVSLTGLCSAAWACLLAASRVHVETVNAVNPSVWDVRPPRYLFRPRTGAASDGPARRPPKLVARARGVARFAARRVLPEPVWWRLGRSGHVEAPAGLITPLLLGGTRVRILFGTDEAATFRERRGARLIARFGHGGLLDVHEAEDVDHALMSVWSRDVVADLLLDG